MDRKLFQLGSWSMWLAPVVIGLRYWMVWNRLPMRVASHFDAAGRANGWMTRDMSLYVTLGFMASMIAVFSLVLHFIGKKYPLAKLSWTLLLFFQVEIWTLAYMLNSTVDYNLDGTPIVIAPFLLLTALGTLVILGVALMEKRGLVLSSADVVAEEVHSGKIWGALLLAPFVAVVASLLNMTSPAARASFGIVSVVIIAMAAMAWDGFHYLFTRRGVEIRTLGFRLKSIPFPQIKSYEIANWSPARGYGIRGVGNHKAYVWGNKGVRVEMYDGEIFLGHNDPQRIVHDLNVIRSKQ